MTVLAPAVPSQSAPSRQVAATVAGATVVLPCPLWCTHPHNEEYRALPDVSHHSDELTLSVPVHGGVDSTLVTRISCWPFADEAATAVPFVSCNPVGDEFAQLTPEAATALADQVIAHGYAMRAVARSISG
ncbi:DUF6907 domain-containing protein [Streptomyces bugieae]|uniref:Uncharacterized protein n=1 Tax=Streptomyces bugieae TaxID=3098223 RepID=A0ABU7NL14_9ACTN|nr:hypothetical protein [Streptomyces sp. DSM 41528]